MPTSTSGHRETDVHEEGTGPAEIYVALLSRLGRHADAIRAAVELLPPGVRRAAFAPNLLELSRLAGDYAPLMQVCRERGDLVSFTAGLLESRKSL